MKKKLLNAIKLLEVNLNLSVEERSLLNDLKRKVSNLVEETLSKVTSSNEISRHKDLIDSKYDMVVYSDGACRGNPGPGSYGLYIENLNESTYTESDSFKVTTNNKMELLGIIKGLEYAIKEDAKRVLVVTDSKYAINGMESWMAGWKARGWKKADKKTPENVEMWQILDRYKDKFSLLNFEWVKGHSGHPQNELCDQLANKALDEAGF